MKIALLSYEYPAETGFGGIGTYTWYQARALVKLGHEVHVVAGSRDAASLEPDHHDGVRVWRNRGRGPARLLGKLLDRSRLWWSANRFETAFDMYRGLRRLRRSHSFDVIEMPECGAEGLLVNRLVSVPSVVRLHSPARLIMGFYDVTRLDRWLCAALEQGAISSASAWSACSAFLRDEAAGRLGVEGEIAVISNGIDVDLFDATAVTDADERFGLPPDRPVILFCGRMEERKGIHLCPEIAAAILAEHEVALVFAGEDLFGYMKSTLLPALAGRELAGSVHYLGKLGLVDVRSCLARAEIVLIPSLWENCPYSCLEAMAAGCAVVSSNAGGMPELIHDGDTGLVARSGDAGSFIEALGRLVRNPSLRRDLGSRARRAIEQSYRDTAIAERSLDFYRSVIERSKT